MNMDDGGSGSGNGLDFLREALGYAASSFATYQAANSNVPLNISNARPGVSVSSGQAAVASAGNKNLVTLGIFGLLAIVAYKLIK